MAKFILYTAIALLFYGLGEYFSKWFANSSKTNFGVLATLCYTVTCIFWLPVLRMKNSIAILTTLWTIFYVIIAVFVGVLLFQEKLSTNNIIGIVLALVSCVFLCL